MRTLIPVAIAGILAASAAVSQTTITVVDNIGGTVDGDSSALITPVEIDGIIYNCITPDKILDTGNTSYDFADGGVLTTSNAVSLTGYALTQTQIGEIANLVATSDADANQTGGYTLAALQAAIWEVEGAKVVTNNATLDADISADIQTAAAEPLTNTVDVLSATNASTQTLAHNVVAVTPGVPEPATWTLMILGVGAVGGALRSQRRRTLAA